MVYLLNENYYCTPSTHSAPLSLAETSWDNVGILLQALMPELNKGKKVMLAIDLTTDVVEEALEQQEDQVAVIIVYHPCVAAASSWDCL